VDGIGSQTIYNNYGALAFYADGDNWKSFAWSHVPGIEWDNANNAVVGFGRFWAGTTGSDGFPAIALSTDTDTGIHWPAANQLAFSLGGQRRLELANQVSIFPYGASTGQTGSLRLYNLGVTGSVTLRAHDTSGAYGLTFPPTLPGSTQCLAFDTTGAGSFAACSGGGGSIGGSGTIGTLSKFVGSTTTIGDSILSEASAVLTTAGKQVINGATISTDATGTVASLTSKATFTRTTPTFARLMWRRSNQRSTSAVEHLHDRQPALH